MLKQSILRDLCLFAALVFLSLSPMPAKAQGNLLINPRRIIFEGSKKAQEINLANVGKDTANFLISLNQMRMKEDGSFELIERPDSGQKFADTFLRFFPHHVRLAPNEAQVVKIQVSRSAQMAEGEYISHLYFRASPEQKPLGENKVLAASSGVSVSLIPVFGISIPVIIRVGKNNAAVSLSKTNLSFNEDGIPKLAMLLNRSGNMSVYGNIEVAYLSESGTKIQVGQARGLAIYASNPKRYFEMPLQKKEGVDYHSGKLQILYSTDPDPKSSTLAETIIKL